MGIKSWAVPAIKSEIEVSRHNPISHRDSRWSIKTNNFLFFFSKEKNHTVEITTVSLYVLLERLYINQLYVLTSINTEQANISLFLKVYLQYLSCEPQMTPLSNKMRMLHAYTVYTKRSPVKIRINPERVRLICANHRKTPVQHSNPYDVTNIKRDLNRWNNVLKIRRLFKKIMLTLWPTQRVTVFNKINRSNIFPYLSIVRTVVLRVPFRYCYWQRNFTRTAR